MRKLIIAIACCIVLLLLGYTGYRGYHVWKQNHLLAMAKTFAQQGNARNELLCLQQAIQVNPRNVEACRLMANLTEVEHSASAIAWRQRTVDLNPNSLDDRLSLAQTAIFFKDLKTASNALAGVSDAGKQTALYHNVAGILDLNLGQMPDAEKNFSEAVRLDPSNPAPQLNLAVVRLHSSNTLDMAEARIDLKHISMTSTNLSLRSQAKRELITDALTFKHMSTALALSKELAEATNATFSDQLLRLDVLKVAKNTSLEPAIAQCQREAVNDATNDTTKLADMDTWMMTRISPAATLTWLQTLPMSIQTNQPAALHIAECQMIGQDWSTLEKSLEKQNWDNLEFARHAFLARALQEENLSGASTAEWQSALKYGSSQLIDPSVKKTILVQLYNWAAVWKWNDDAVQVLWMIVNGYPGEKWAVQTLKSALYLDGRTRPLMQLLSIQLKRTPGDLATQNDLALTAMLLGEQDLNPYNLASQVYAQQPKNPSFVSTYAFALYLQKKYPEALKTMRQLTPQELSNPSIAGYYGLILKANGDNAQAKTYLALTAKARLLPEEKTLFQRALTNLKNHSRDFTLAK